MFHLNEMLNLWLPGSMFVNSDGSYAGSSEPSLFANARSPRISSVALFYIQQWIYNRVIYFSVLQNNSTTDVKTLRDFHTVATLQDQAQMTLSKYIQTSYPTQPFRFGKLLLLLPTLKTVNGSTIEELFFRKTIGSIPIERLLVDMFKSSDFWGDSGLERYRNFITMKKWKAPRCLIKKHYASRYPSARRGKRHPEPGVRLCGL